MTDAADPPPPEEPPMEIHKPKPVHNWREFLKEYAIIVLGVLTALALEQQAVEWLHWSNGVGQARKAILAEIAENDRIFAVRIAIAPCFERQAREADQIIADLQAGRKPGTFTTFHRGFGSMLSESEWQSERASQTLTHFPREELALMGRYYAMRPVVHEWLSQEGDAWQELVGLGNPPANIDASELLRLRAALSKAQTMEWVIVTAAMRQLSWSRQLGATPQPGDPKIVKGFCTKNDEEFQGLNRSYQQTH